MTITLMILGYIWIAAGAALGGYDIYAVASKRVNTISSVIQNYFGVHKAIGVSTEILWFVSSLVLALHFFRVF